MMMKMKVEGLEGGKEEVPQRHPGARQDIERYSVGTRSSPGGLLEGNLTGSQAHWQRGLPASPGPPWGPALRSVEGGLCV